MTPNTRLLTQSPTARNFIYLVARRRFHMLMCASGLHICSSITPPGQRVYSCQGHRLVRNTEAATKFFCVSSIGGFCLFQFHVQIDNALSHAWLKKKQCFVVLPFVWRVLFQCNVLDLVVPLAFLSLIVCGHLLSFSSDCHRIGSLHNPPTLLFRNFLSNL